MFDNNTKTTILEMGKFKTTEQFIKDAEAIHGNKYSYVSVNYTHSYTAVQIICMKHGSFLQQPFVHLQGKGCVECGRSRSGGGLKNFKKDSHTARLYIIKCSSTSESFYKIGITTGKLERRFYNIPYNVELIKEIVDDSTTIYYLEKHLHQLNEQHNYMPVKKFAGYRECFSQLEETYE